MKVKTSVTTVSELSWLSEVRESGPRLDLQTPVTVRHFVMHSGHAMLNPECHPYCEFGLHLDGSGVEYVERENATRRAGDVFIAGPGIPHWFKITSYPLIGIAVYFLPSLLCELGPKQDGLNILRRFTSSQNLKNRLVRPSPALRQRFIESFKEIHKESEQPAVGSEIRLRTILLDMLIDLVRWEHESGQNPKTDISSPKWEHVNLALHYLKEHFAEPVYAHDVAKAVGVSESRLKVLFKEALGIPWSRYIQGYRIQQAIALLGTSTYNVTQVALEVGFESLSHFNSTFRSFTGVSPSVYLSRQSKMANL